MGNINKKVDKLIAKRQWDKLLHNLGETNGEFENEDRKSLRRLRRQRLY